MALDVQEITGTDAAAAARLCNFATGGAILLPAHRKWLDTKVRPLVVGNPSAWVDVIGHASRQWRQTGGANSHDLNRRLSADRCAAVKRYVDGYNPTARFNVVLAEGDIQSLGPKPDDGYDRAVEVFVYATGPSPVPPPLPGPFKTHMKWSICGYFSLMTSVMDVAQFGVGFFKLRDDETGDLGVRCGVVRGAIGQENVWQPQPAQRESRRVAGSSARPGPRIRRRAIDALVRASPPAVGSS
jgi:hypothetical protein